MSKKNPLLDMFPSKEIEEEGHAGHRMRLKRRFLRYGMASFDPKRTRPLRQTRRSPMLRPALCAAGLLFDQYSKVGSASYDLHTPCDRIVFLDLCRFFIHRTDASVNRIRKFLCSVVIKQPVLFLLNIG